MLELMPNLQLSHSYIARLLSRKKQYNSLAIKQYRFGFTLIELLVVISIIAILITVIVATFGTTQEKARDNRRKTDLDALKKSLEIAKSDTRGSSWYPYCDTRATSTSGGSEGQCNIDDREVFSPPLKERYIKEIPTDPSTGVGYLYDPSNCDTSGKNNGCTDYLIVACLENADDADQDTNTAGDYEPHNSCGVSTTSEPKASYSIVNP